MYQIIKKIAIVLFPTSIAFFAIQPTLVSYNHAVKSDYYVVEGWLETRYLNELQQFQDRNKTSHFITTGAMLPASILMNYNGFLIINMKSQYSVVNLNDKHVIKLTVSGTTIDMDSSAFNLRVNDSIILTGKVGEEPQLFTTQIPNSDESIQTLSVEFLNDMFSGKDDMFITLNKLEVNGYVIPLRSKNVYYDMYALDGKDKYCMDYTSFAEYARNRLIYAGIDSANITAIPGPSVRFNRTYQSARPVCEYLKNNFDNIDSINLVTELSHSRRSRLIYRKLLGTNIEVGVVAFDDLADHTFIEKKYVILKEFLSLLYYRFLFLFL
jgi:uncharacterized SAM-binding protein YcdF (DUF218 family)